MQKRTKILATIGPASDSSEVIEGLIKAGADLFRLNFSHGTYAQHFQTLQRIRKIAKKLNTIVGIVQDISGPKVRIGELDKKFDLKHGDRITFVAEKIIGHQTSENSYEVSLNYPDILKNMKRGDWVYLYDGIIRAQVISAGEKVEVEIENHGILSSKKGVNFPNTYLGIDILTNKDREDIAWGVANEVDFFAISFVQNAEDMRRARKLLEGYGGKLIAKIEKFDAIENIDEIIEASDAIMVARGDLGIEVPYYDVPTLQKMLIRKANAAAKPVITATQMLLTMTTNTSPTRAEVSDVANAVLDGTDIVMLSEESAIGDDPVHVVDTMHSIIAQTEKHYPFRKADALLEKKDVIMRSLADIADELNVTAILMSTSSGQSVGKLSSFRPKTKIYAFSHRKKTLSQLSSNWGVRPVSTIEMISPSKVMQGMLLELDARGKLDKKGLYVSAIGYPLGVPGSTNTIKILNETEISYYMHL